MQLGVPLTITNASSKLGGVNSNDQVSFNIGVLPTANLTNDVSLGGNANVTITAGHFAYHSVLGSLGTTLYGPKTFNLASGTIGTVYNKTFNMDPTGFGQKIVTGTV
jgi:hypothetical protein